MSAHVIAHQPISLGWLSQALNQLRRRFTETPVAPALTRAEVVTREANEARAYAQRIQAREPRMATEIMAAADRHESQFDR